MGGLEEILQHAPGLGVALLIVFVFVRYLSKRDEITNKIARDSLEVMRKTDHTLGATIESNKNVARMLERVHDRLDRSTETQVRDSVC